MTDLTNSVKTFTFEGIKFYVIKKLNDFYISRKEVYKFFNRKTSVSLKNVFNIRDNYPKTIDTLTINDNGTKITFLNINDLTDVIDFHSKNNATYFKKFSKFKSYLDLMNRQFGLMEDKFNTDLDIYYRLECKSDDKIESYYIIKVLQGVNKHSKKVNVFQSTSGDLRVELESFLNNINYDTTSKETDLLLNAINIKQEFPNNYGKCYIDNDSVVRPITYVTFIGLERFFSKTLPQFYSAYRTWYETVVKPVFNRANEVKKLTMKESGIDLSNFNRVAGGVLMKDDLKKSNTTNQSTKEESLVINEDLYKDINQIYSNELKSKFNSKSDFINYLLKQSISSLKNELLGIDKQLETLESKRKTLDNQILEINSLKQKKIKEFLEK